MSVEQLFTCSVQDMGSSMYSKIEAHVARSSFIELGTWIEAEVQNVDGTLGQSVVRLTTAHGNPVNFPSYTDT